MSEQIVTGKKYKILADATNKVWHVISFISQAVDVVFTNGKNAQTTLGSITGISDSLTSTSSNVAASAASVKALNDKITELSSNLGGELKMGEINAGNGISYILNNIPSKETYVLFYVNSYNGARRRLVSSVENGEVISSTDVESLGSVSIIKTNNSNVTVNINYSLNSGDGIVFYAYIK